MSYKLYTDKNNKFSCNIQVDGTSLANSKVRLVVESEGISYLFDGKIFENGNCEVNIPKTKNFLSENSKGNMRLEVIADDVFFEPWNSDYMVETTKKVAVVVQEQVNEKPKMTVAVNRQPETSVIKETAKPKIPIQTKSKTPQLSKKDILDLLKK